jgi:hypothetical protein
MRGKGLPLSTTQPCVLTLTLNHTVFRAQKEHLQKEVTSLPATQTTDSSLGSSVSSSLNDMLSQSYKRALLAGTRTASLKFSHEPKGLGSPRLWKGALPQNYTVFTNPKCPELFFSSYWA